MSELVRSSLRLVSRRNDCDSIHFRVPPQFGIDRTEYWESANDLESWSISQESTYNKSVDWVPQGTTYIASEGLWNILDFKAEDQVVQVEAGIPIGNLNAELRLKGQCIPIPEFEDGSAIWSGTADSVGTLIAMNFPHALQAQCGSWRDWVLGMTVVLADGSIVRCGSKAVKNVAGYDVHKWIVGTRDTIGILVDVTLRTFPSEALPQPVVERRLSERETAKRQGALGMSGWWIQRVLPTDWHVAIEGVETAMVAADHASCTLYALASTETDLPRYPGDWVIRSGCGEKNVQINDPTQLKLMKRAKEVFDPTNKLNPGEWGFM